MTGGQRDRSGEALSLTELWLCQREILGFLGAFAVHRLNNLLAAVETNVFLIEAATPEPFHGPVAAVRSALRDGQSIREGLLRLGVRPPIGAEPPIRVGDVAMMIEALLARLGRADLETTFELPEPLVEERLPSPLFRVGFMTLVAFAAYAVLPGGTLRLGIGAGARAHQLDLSLELAPVVTPDFIGVGGAATAKADLGELIGWLVRQEGGELLIDRSRPSRLSIRLAAPRSSAFDLSSNTPAPA